MIFLNHCNKMYKIPIIQLNYKIFYFKIMLKITFNIKQINSIIQTFYNNNNNNILTQKINNFHRILILYIKMRKIIKSLFKCIKIFYKIRFQLFYKNNKIKIITIFINKLTANKILNTHHYIMKMLDWLALKNNLMHKQNNNKSFLLKKRMKKAKIIKIKWKTIFNRLIKTN